MKAKLTRLVTVIVAVVALALVATSASSVMSYGPGESRGMGLYSLGTTRSVGSDDVRHFGVERGFHSGFQNYGWAAEPLGFDNLGRLGKERVFRGERRFRDYGHGRFAERDFGDNRYSLGVTVPLYYQPDYYEPYYYGSSYDALDYDYGYDFQPSGLAYLNNDIGAVWLDSTTLQVMWLGAEWRLNRLDYKLLDEYRRELMQISSYNPPYRAALLVPSDAAYVNVRAIGQGGLVLSDVTSPLP